MLSIAGPTVESISLFLTVDQTTNDFLFFSVGDRPNGYGSKLNDRRGKPQVLVPMLPLTDRATHFGNYRFFEPQPNLGFHPPLRPRMLT